MECEIRVADLLPCEMLLSSFEVVVAARTALERVSNKLDDLDAPIPQKGRPRRGKTAYFNTGRATEGRVIDMTVSEDGFMAGGDYLVQ